MTSLTGTIALVRLIVRRDRRLIAIWILTASMIPIGVAAGFIKGYPTAAALRAFADQCMSNPTIVAMLGPIFAPTVGGLTAWRTSVSGAMAMGISSILMVIRHTRTEEETGRSELVRSAVIGRHAPLSAALIVVLKCNFAIGAIIALGLMGVGLPASGSIAIGLSWAAAGAVFAAIASATAQLSQSAAACRGIALGLFGLFFAFKAAGDSGSELLWLSWLSPLGWMRLMRPFAVERWWVLLLFAGFALAAGAGGFALSSQRDLGAGVLPDRRGPAAATAALSGPFALAWRLHREMFFTWTLGLMIFGALLGSVGRTLTSVLNTPGIDHWLAQIGSHDSAHAFLRMVIYVLGQTTSAYAIMAALMLWSEESRMRAEPVLAAAVSRTRWLCSHLLFAAVGPAIALGATGLAVGFTYGLSTGALEFELSHQLVVTIFTLPAVWVMAGIAIAMFGLLPRLAVSVTWAILAAVLLLELAWEMRQISQSVFELSPFAWVHWTQPATLAPMIRLTMLAAFLTAAGFAGIQRRDIG